MKEDSNENEESFIMAPTDEDNEDSSPKPPVSGGPRLGGLPPLGEPRRRKKCCTDVKGTKGIKVAGMSFLRNSIFGDVDSKAPLVLLVVLIGPMLLPGIIWAWNKLSDTELAVKLGMRMDHRTRLVNFYKEHSPEKIQEVDRILRKYKGRENMLFHKLEEIYKRREAIKKEEEEFRRNEAGYYSD